MNKISIVFPIYNEENRIGKLLKRLKNLKKKKYYNIFEFIFVDDGSTDQTIKKIEDFFFKNKRKSYRYKIIKSKKNFGKGHALKLGVKAAKYNWIITMDVDLSVELYQIDKWKKKYFFKNDYAYFGSRNISKSAVKYKYHRKIIGMIWQMIFSLCVDSKIKDTQCGFKLYNKKYIKKIFNSLTENGFAHDIELIFLLKREGVKIKELPVEWKHSDGSKLNIYLEPIKFFFRLWALVIKYKFN